MSICWSVGQSVRHTFLFTLIGSLFNIPPAQMYGYPFWAAAPEGQMIYMNPHRAIFFVSGVHPPPSLKQAPMSLSDLQLGLSDHKSGL